MSEDHGVKDQIAYLGQVDYRNKAITFGIKAKDRTKHMYVIGKSGMGKSTLLENLAIQDIANGEGICVIDPHGSMAEKLLDHIPSHRVKDVVYFAPFDAEHPVGLNMLERVPADKRYLVASGLMSAFKKIFTDGDGKATFSARMEYVLNYIILALLENDNQTLLGINRMLFDKEYRKTIVSNVTDPTVKDFWVNEYANYTEKTTQELAPSIQNKVGQFVSNPLIRNIIGQQKTSFNVRELMDNKKILIVNLSKGKVGEGNANLLGSLLITKIYLAAMSRADIDPYEAEKLPPFYFYVDEFQNFANESFASILSEARKYKLALTVAHQYVEQMTDEVKSAVFGNVGTMVTFRIGATDAEVFEKEFAPYFILDDFVNLSAHQVYMRLMIDGQGSKPFSAQTLSPIQKPAQSFAQDVIANSRQIYGRPRAQVEEEVQTFYSVLNKKPEPRKDVGASPVYERQDERQVRVREITTDTKPRSAYPPRERSQEGSRTEYAPQTHTPQQDRVPYDRNRTDRPARQERRPFDDRPPRTSRETPPPSEPAVESHAPVQNPVAHSHPHEEVLAEQNTQPKSVMFDNAKPMSLKEALEKAMKEKSPSIETSVGDKQESPSKATPQASHASDTAFQHTNIHTTASHDDTPPVRKEVSEEVLRKLLSDE